MKKKEYDVRFIVTETNEYKATVMAKNKEDAIMQTIYGNFEGDSKWQDGDTHEINVTQVKKVGE